MQPQEFLELIHEYNVVTNHVVLNSIASLLPWFEVFCGLLLLTGVAVRGAALALIAPWPCLAGDKEEGWINLFNGKDLDGWVQRGGKAKYRALDGQIVGSSVPNTQYLGSSGLPLLAPMSKPGSSVSGSG